MGNSLIQGLTVYRKEYGDYAIDVKVIKGLNNQTWHGKEPLTTHDALIFTCHSSGFLEIYTPVLGVRMEEVLL